MARPKGSKNKPKVPLVEENELGYRVKEHFNDVANGREIPFPEDWDKLTKIAKLQWLKNHKR